MTQFRSKRVGVAFHGYKRIATHNGFIITTTGEGKNFAKNDGDNNKKQERF
jgi:hypothetical protein